MGNLLQGMRTGLQVAALALGVLALEAQAGVNDGLLAYQRGDFRATLAEIQPLASQGVPEAQNLLGLLYRKGQGVPQDFKEAVRWWRAAAEAGLASAQNNLATMYEAGLGVPQNTNEAIRLYKLAAQQGDPLALSTLQNRFDMIPPQPSDGTDSQNQAYREGVQAYARRDYRTAFLHWRSAATQNNGPAQIQLAQLHEAGLGAPFDLAEAANLYRNAAVQGYAVAQNNLGSMYLSGKGVPANPREAVKWFRLAAEQGNGTAQLNLGMMYRSGNSVTKNLVLAHALLNLARANAEQLAAGAITQVESQLSPKQIETAQDLARQMFQPGQLLKVMDRYLEPPPKRS